MSLQRIEHRACFGGWQNVYRHHATTLNCAMNVGVYLPPQTDKRKCPVLYWLSGLTCTEQNFIAKAGAQRYAAEHGIIIVAPDTSPRGDDVADFDSYDLGKGASFYVNATEAPWSAHYRMQDYIARELPDWIEANFPTTNKRAISGHSMGGHGALITALRNPERYCSVSAFSPIVAPSQVPWGEKAFNTYLGNDRNTWKSWDACELIANASEKLPLLIDQGSDDEFLSTQLQPERIKTACNVVQHPLELNMREGYDHSYYFIASFIGEHFKFHSHHFTQSF